MSVPHIRLAPSRGWVPLQLRDLWEYRELLYFLAWRDIKVRYKQTVLGVAWVILQPLLTMLIFSFLFGYLIRVPSDGIPYPIFVFAALLPWQLFAYSLSESSNSLVANQQLITKVYFPRLIIPLATILAGLVDFAIAFFIFVPMMWYYGIPLTVSILILPFFVLLAVVTALAVGVFLSTLNVEYRDVRYTLPFLSQVWLFLTPIAYPSSIVPEHWRALYGLNPMAGVVEGFRWALFGKSEEIWPLMTVSVLVVIGLFVIGLIYFRRTEQTFADVI